MYVVCGATGNTGRVIAQALLKAGKQVRVIGRSTDRLKDLKAKGAEAFAGSVEDAAAMKQAFAGATAAYLMIPPNFDVDDVRAYQDRVSNILTEAVKDAGVKHVVLLSSIGANHPSGTGPIAGLHYFENKLNSVPGVNALYLRAGFFMENLFMNIPLIKNMGINGMPAPGDVAMPMIATQDIGDYAAKRLLALDFSGKDFQYLLGAKDYAMNDVTAVIGKAIGKADLNYVQFSFEDAEQGMIQAGLKPSLAELYVEMYKGASKGKLMPERPRDAESTTPTTIEEFSKVFAAAYSG